MFGSLAVVFIPTIVRALLLKFDGEVATAQVIETDFMPRTKGSINSPYSIQYHFQLPGSRRWYRHQEAMLIGEPAAKVTKKVWDEAKRSGTIRIVYWRHDPTVNLPQDQYALNGILCPSIAASISGILAIAYGRSLVRSFFSGRSATPPGSQH
jgi:hypothetical protein